MKTIAVVLLALLAFAFAEEKPSLKASITNPMLTMLKDAVIGQVSKSIKDMKMRDFETNILIAKVSAKNVTMHMKPFTGKQIGIEYVEGTNDIIFRGHGLDLNGSLALTVQIFFVSYECKGYMNATNASFESRITLIQNGTRLAVEVKSVTVEMAKENVSVRIEGKILQDLINAMIGFLQTYFFENIKAAMNELLPGIITTVVNTILGELPDDVPVSNGMAAKFIFTHPPTIKTGYMITPILAYVHMQENKNPPTHQPPELPDINATCGKGLQFFMSDYIIRSAVDTAHTAGILKFSKNFTALGFNIVVKCHTNSAPTIKFASKIEFVGSSYCDAMLILKGTSYNFSLAFSATVAANLTEMVKDSKMFFNVQQMAVIDLKIIFGMVIDLKTILQFVNMYLDEVRRVLNREIATKGLPIPTFKLFDISDVTEYLVGRYIFLCGSLKPKYEAIAKLDFGLGNEDYQLQHYYVPN